MFIDWTDYQKKLNGLFKDFAKLSPDTLKGYQTLATANSQSGVLGAKTRELISIAVAVTTKCDGCIAFHVDGALKAGATKEEISEALAVAIATNAGGALIYSARVLDAVEAHKAGQ